jgi:anaerobic selenocysteine-containing dehydrogenase
MGFEGEKDVSRRGFLKGAALTGAAAVVPGGVAEGAQQKGNGAMEEHGSGAVDAKLGPNPANMAGPCRSLPVRSVRWVAPGCRFRFSAWAGITWAPQRHRKR